MSIKFPTLENKEIYIETEDATYIGLESSTIASILTGSSKEKDYGHQRFGGNAINFAMEYCKKFGQIKASCSLWSGFKSDAISSLNYYYSLGSSPEFELKCKEADVEAWVDNFIDQITKVGMGMVHELLAVSEFLLAFRLSDLICQYIFDYLTFKHYGEFRKTFGISFLFPPYCIKQEPRNLHHVMEDILHRPTLVDICNKFNAEFPFTSSELDLAELENQSIRVGGILEYKNEDKVIKDCFIKIEYLVRRLSSFLSLSIWMENAFSERFTESMSLADKFFDNESHNDIEEFHLTINGHASKFYQDIICLQEIATNKIENPCTSHEDIDLITDGINKIVLEVAEKANIHKAKIENQVRLSQTEWETDHPHHKEKVLPHLIFFLENRYHEIFCLLCTIRGWTNPKEAQDNLKELNDYNKNVLEYTEDQNEDQYDDVENEEQNEYHYDVVESEEKNEDFHDDVESELISPKSNADDKNMDRVVSSLMTLQYLAVGTSCEFSRTYQCYVDLQIQTRHLLHLDLLLNDERILTFICREKLNMYMRASKQRRSSKISFAEDKSEFDRIMKETTQKFGERELVIEKAKKYFRHFQMFHYAMVDETERQIELHSKYVKGSRKRKYAG